MSKPSYITYEMASHKARDYTLIVSYKNYIVSKNNKNVSDIFTTQTVNFQAFSCNPASRIPDNFKFELNF